MDTIKYLVDTLYDMGGDMIIDGLNKNDPLYLYRVEGLIIFWEWLLHESIWSDSIPCECEDDLIDIVSHKKKAENYFSIFNREGDKNK